MKLPALPFLHLDGVLHTDHGETLRIHVALAPADNPRKQRGQRVRGHIDITPSPSDLNSHSHIVAERAAPTTEIARFSPKTPAVGSLTVDPVHGKIGLGLSFPGQDGRGYRLASDAYCPYVMLSLLLSSSRPTHHARSRTQPRSSKTRPGAILGQILRHPWPAIEFVGAVTESGKVIYRVTLRADLQSSLRELFIGRPQP